MLTIPDVLLPPSRHTEISNVAYLYTVLQFLRSVFDYFECDTSGFHVACEVTL